MFAANLGNSTTVGRIEIDPTVKMAFLTAGGFYRLGTWDLSDVPAEKVPTTTVDVLAGAVYGQSRKKLMQDFPGVFAREHSYLALSGGRAKGAFGAGLLVGWSATGTRPEFTMVTGISTGALMALFVFLCTAYDAQLKERGFKRSMMPCSTAYLLFRF